MLHDSLFKTNHTFKPKSYDIPTRYLVKIYSEAYHCNLEYLYDVRDPFERAALLDATRRSRSNVRIRIRLPGPVQRGMKDYR